MAANCNHEECRLLYNKMKSHYIYNAMNYTVARYVTQHSQSSSVQSLAYFTMSFTTFTLFFKDQALLQDDELVQSDEQAQGQFQAEV